MAKGAGTVKAIGGFKLVKGLLLLIVAGGILSHINADWENSLAHLLRNFYFDPDSKYFTGLMTKVANLSPNRHLVIIGMSCYGLLFCVEGVGLLLQKRWAEYLTVIATGSFVPLEIYETVKQVSVTRVIVLILNVAVVVYLIVRLKRDKQRA